MLEEFNILLVKVKFGRVFMSNFFKMTTLGLILSTMLSTSVYAASLVCTMEYDKTVKAEITFHELGFIDQIRVKSTEFDEIIFSSNDNEMQVSTYVVTANDLINNSFLAGMKKYAKLKNENYKTVDFQSIVSKNRTGDLQEVTDYISDDGSGIGFLRFKDNNNNLVGTSLFLGWAGVYNNCK